MRHRYTWKSPTVVAHAVLWLALSVGAFTASGAYSFASCWQVYLIYLPPLGILYLMVAAFGIAGVIASYVLPRLQDSKFFAVARHALILAVGMQACSLAAHIGGGQVSCL